MEKDARLKKLLIQKGKRGYAILYFYNQDSKKHKANQKKKNQFLRQLIIDNGFEFKEIQTYVNKVVTYYSYIVIEKFDDGFNETGIRLAEFLEMVEKHELLSNLKIIRNSNIKEFLEDKTFYHPIRKSEKNEYLNRKEIILTDLFEPPETIGVWSIRKAHSENSIIYHNGDMLCGISLQPDGKWKRSYGIIKPVGALLREEFIDTREEAFKNLSNPFGGKWRKNKDANDSEKD